ncbi:MAG: sigma-70 family RNA polymerase sigma factor [Saprospiraceae bacterium]|nr:sigma-70 family RNA polymerase sigma factor [Saprospiraceae bacterium]MCB0543792.1 sigma-70 family RNA polymerase sigma factor [Saprospiraceae bacterium]MCB0573986.1 sigma-70 family RNA polymerase sigma factor [Saprospiraceae bacterium]
MQSNNEMDATQTHRDLIERCREGRRDAQFELYRLYSRAMYNTALRMVQNPHDAEDILQSIFIEVFGKLDTFRYESSIGAWIKRITVNKCINFLKSRRLSFSELTPYNDRAEEHVHDGEPAFNIEQINKAIADLPDGYRVVFNLYAVEGYDHEEIAYVLGITEATSKSQYSRAKAKLRDALGTNGKFKRDSA